MYIAYLVLLTGHALWGDGKTTQKGSHTNGKVHLHAELHVYTQVDYVPIIMGPVIDRRIIQISINTTK